MDYSCRQFVAQCSLSVRILTVFSDTAVQCEREKVDICIQVAANSILTPSLCFLAAHQLYSLLFPSIFVYM